MQNSAQLGNDKHLWFIHVVMDTTYLGTLTEECRNNSLTQYPTKHGQAEDLVV